MINRINWNTSFNLKYVRVVISLSLVFSMWLWNGKNINKIRLKRKTVYGFFLCIHINYMRCIHMSEHWNGIEKTPNESEKKWCKYRSYLCLTKKKLRNVHHIKSAQTDTVVIKENKEQTPKHYYPTITKRKYCIE